MSHFENQEEEINHVNSLWEKEMSSRVITLLKQGSSLQEILDAEALKKPLVSPDTMKCSDGRCYTGLGSIYSAGGGMLATDEEFGDIIKKNPNLKILTSHDGCGASEILFAYYKDNNIPLPECVTTPAELAVWWAKDKAQKFGLEHQHISTEELNDIHHHELGIWVDGTGNLDPGLISGMPNVFTSELASVSKGKSFVKETEALTGIGLGKHGLDKFLDKNPFYIFICAKDEVEIERLIALVKEAVGKYGNKVAIKTAISPF